MPDTLFGPNSSFVCPTYHSIEEVNSVVRATGWDGEFHQLGKGRITSTWQSLHLGASSLCFHRLDNHVHVRQTPPKGCVAMAIVPTPHTLLVDGAEVSNHEMILMHAGSETDFVVPGESACETLSVPRADFEQSVRALFPGMHTNGRPVRVCQGDPSRVPALRREMTGLLRDGRMSLEGVSNLLTRFLELMAGDPGNSPGEKSLGNGSARRVARCAQEYIEEHYPGTIRMEDLCCHTKVSLRTLQRSFAGYFQVTPSEFIRARRLDAARRGLLAADSSQHTVTSVAIDSGFTHLGRFSVEYRDHFGELPRETLAKPAPPERGPRPG